VSNLRERLELAYAYLRNQLGESSTVNGIASMVMLVGGLKLTKIPPEIVMTVTMLVSQTLRIILPDKLPWSRK
jgi:hypothetical protein